MYARVQRRFVRGATGLIALGCVIGCVYFIAVSPRDVSNTEPPNSGLSTAGLGCGPAALLAVARSHDAQTATRLSSILERDGLTARSFTSFYDLAACARQVGLDPVGLKIDTGRLSRLPLPAIVHVKPDHFLALVAVSEDRVVVTDQGAITREIPRREFDRRFSGHVLCFRRTDLERGQDS